MFHYNEIQNFFSFKNLKIVEFVLGRVKVDSMPEFIDLQLHTLHDDILGSVINPPSMQAMEYCLLLSPYIVPWCPGGHLNIKMSSYKYRDPHVKDKTVLRPSYL